MRTRLAPAPALGVLLALALVACCTSSAWAAGCERGTIDGSFLLDFADEDGDLVELHIPGILLKRITEKKLAKGHEEWGPIRKLCAVHALVITPTATRREQAVAAVKDLEKKLISKKWERMVRVREQGSRINVFVDTDGQMAYGVVVLIISQEPGDKSLVFANIAGEFDLDSLLAIADDMDWPGFDRIPRN